MGPEKAFETVSAWQKHFKKNFDRKIDWAESIQADGF